MLRRVQIDWNWVRIIIYTRLPSFMPLPFLSETRICVQDKLSDLIDTAILPRSNFLITVRVKLPSHHSCL